MFYFTVLSEPILLKFALKVLKALLLIAHLLTPYFTPLPDFDWLRHVVVGEDFFLAIFSIVCRVEIGRPQIFGKI